MFKTVFLILLLGLPSIFYAQNATELVPVKDLKNQWLTVDRNATNYVPYVEGRSLNYPVLGLVLDAGVGTGLILSACIPDGTSVFVNNTIVQQTGSQGCVFYDVDSLKSQYHSATLFLSFFRKNLNPNMVSTTLMTRQPAGELQGQIKPTVQITRRTGDQFMDFFIVAILLTAAYYAFLVNRYPRGNKDFFNFSKAFSLMLKEEKVLTQRNMSTTNTLFFWLYAMIIALVIMLFWHVFGGIPEIFGFISLTTFKSCLLSWAGLSLIAFSVVELKHLLIRILSSLLNVDKIAQIHFFDFIRISLIFVGSTLVVASIFYLTGLAHEVPFIILLYAFVILLGVRIIILLFKLIGESSFRKIHLISYLCTTEILPLLIGIRIFF